MTQFVGDVHLYEDEFPEDRKPPPVAPGDGRRLLEAREPVYSVDLDAGALRAVWELLESEAKHRYPTRETMAGARALLRAVDSFRSVWWSHHPSAPPRRILSRPGRRQHPLKAQHPPAQPAPGIKLVRRQKKGS